MLCLCMGYSHEEIEKMIREGDFSSVSDFQNETFVGTGCGRCLPVVDEIFEKKDKGLSPPEQ